jgi:hypothetical protein
VAGDVFIKVAWEEPFQDAAGLVHPGRVRIIPLNPSFCFPEFHPHDRMRMIRFKLKYRFWGCVDTQTEALTRRGWLRYDEITEDDEILSLDPETDEIRWQPVQAVNVHEGYPGHMVAWDNHIDAVTTPNHRWLVEKQQGRGDTLRYERGIARTEFALDGDPSVGDLRNGSKVIVGGGTPLACAEVAKYSDELVETVGWYVTEGWDHVNQTGVRSIYLAQKREEGLARLRRLKAHWQAEGATFSEYAPKKDGVVTFYLGKGVGTALREVAPGKTLTPEFISSLTFAQAQLLYNTLMLADGSVRRDSERWTQTDPGRVDGFQMLCALLGKRTALTGCGEKVQVYKRRHILSNHTAKKARRVHTEDGTIWCPTVEGGIWFARRNGSTYWTGNTSLEGTRQVFTYTELVTDDYIEEYINDELIDSRPNPIGEIPIVHIPNIPVASSPWGLSDIQDIIGLNREYNEKATDVSDIINYHSAPVTVITGAKASQLEKGPKKVWGGLPKDAQVFNLELGAGLEGPLAYLELLKRAMHELTGVPESALGQMQPISNTSGVALSIQYQPLMNRWNLKRTQYGKGLEKVNALIIKHLFIYRPEDTVWNPVEEPPLRDGQVDMLDPQDPTSYRSVAHFPEPLPLDVLVKLNEIQGKMALGLESKRGALRSLGEEFVDDKLQELFNELVQDTKEQGALDYMRTQIQASIMAATGMLPDGSGPTPPTTGETNDPRSGGASTKGALPGPMIELSAEASDLLNEITTLAYGTKIPQARTPDNTD